MLGIWLTDPPFNKIVVGSEPLDAKTKEELEFLQMFDVMVNVSDHDSFRYPFDGGGVRYWYPINELGRFPYGVFFWAKKILDHHYDKGHSIYIHCHAGAYRSPAIFTTWLYSRGYSWEEACKIAKFSLDKINRVCSSGEFPKKENLEKFYKIINENPTWNLGAVLYNQGDWVEKCIEADYLEPDESENGK